MSNSPITLSLATQADWDQLSPAPLPPEGGYLAWLRDTPMARFSFQMLADVVELGYFYIGKEFQEEYGAAVMQQIVALARERGRLITTEYPAIYSDLFIHAYFKQNTRTRMAMVLADRPPLFLRLPDGITLRPPTPADEVALAEMAYRNYAGTPDADMVSSSPQQAAAMMKAIFANDYATLDTACSFIAEDGSGVMVGSIMLGDESKSPLDTLVWVLDVSVAPQWRGKGLGRALFAAALTAAQPRYQRIGLMVTIGNWAAQSLYRAFGFREYGPLMYEAILHLRLKTKDKR